MHYDQYLARGCPLPVASIEGTCKHIVRGRRLDRSGMKWARPGAHAMLQLRSVRINEDWGAYHHFHCQQEHLRLYVDPPPYPTFLRRKPRPLPHDPPDGFWPHPADAKRVMAVLAKRLVRFGLTLHPGKRRRVDFRRPCGELKRGWKGQCFD